MNSLEEFSDQGYRFLVLRIKIYQTNERNLNTDMKAETIAGMTKL